jgi:hypothetical protein
MLTVLCNDCPRDKATGSFMVKGIAFGEGLL